VLGGDDPAAAARYASVAAALKCLGYGAVGPIPTAAEVWDVLNEVAGRQDAVERRS
jgi:2-dehydro-3-deoxygluconokinase